MAVDPHRVHCGTPLHRTDMATVELLKGSDIHWSHRSVSTEKQASQESRFVASFS